MPHAFLSVFAPSRLCVTWLPPRADWSGPSPPSRGPRTATLRCLSRQHRSAASDPACGLAARDEVRGVHRVSVQRRRHDRAVVVGGERLAPTIAAAPWHTCGSAASSAVAATAARLRLCASAATSGIGQRAVARA